MSGWHVTEVADSIHTFPDYESGHVLGLDPLCWCHPIVEHEDPDDGVRYRIPLVAHRDALDRVAPEIEAAVAK